MKEKNQGKFSGSSLRTALLFSVLLCFFRGNPVDHPLGPDSGCQEILTCLKVDHRYLFFGWFHSLSFACELNPVFETHRILLSCELRGAGISHDEVPREGPGGQSLAKASGEPGHPVLPGTKSRPMTQIAFMGFGGNKGQRQECGGPKRQRREEYIFKLSFFSLMGRKGQSISHLPRTSKGSPYQL